MLHIMCKFETNSLVFAFCIDARHAKFQFDKKVQQMTDILSQNKKVLAQILKKEIEKNRNLYPQQ
jgi:hypothetical protein